MTRGMALSNSRTGLKRRPSRPILRETNSAAYGNAQEV